MGDMMTFPASVEEFMEQYKMTDTEHVYSNGTEYVPIYRMKQWFEHCRNMKKLSNMRLIDANALMDEANSDGAYGYVDAKQISEAPTIDAVPVVRCR